MNNITRDLVYSVLGELGRLNLNHSYIRTQLSKIQEPEALSLLTSVYNMVSFLHTVIEANTKDKHD